MKLNQITKMLQQHFRQPEKRKPIFKVAEKLQRTAHSLMMAQNFFAQKLFKANRLAITIDKDLPTPTEAERQEAWEANWALLDNLYCEQNLYETLAQIEFRLSLLKTALALHRDAHECDFSKFSVIFDDAVKQLGKYVSSKVGSASKSPNDYEANRNDLWAVEYWFELQREMSDFIPATAFDEASIHNSGIQILNYFNRLMNCKPEMVVAAFKIIRGTSIEHTATKYKISQSKLRHEVLQIGQILYRMGFITTDFGTIQPADTIPQMRTKEYVELADLAMLKKLADKAKNEYCLPFENQFGIQQMDWAVFERETQRGLAQIGKLL